MSAYVTLAFELMAFAVFALLAMAVPFVRRKRGYWSGRGVRAAAPGTATLAATLPGVRLDSGSLARHRDEAAAAGAAILGLHDGGRPCALACDVRVAADAMSNDGFADAGGDDRRGSLVPHVVDAEGTIAVLPAMAECAVELVTCLEAVANRRLVVRPWTELKKCAAAMVATCVYGLPMIDSRIKAFAERCDEALDGRRRGRPTITDYFSAYDLTSDDQSTTTTTTDFKRLLREAAVNYADKIGGPDGADKQVRLDMFEFVTGTIEPTATLVTAALYELAHDKTIQSRLRECLDSELEEHQKQITIDQLDRLTYLENVLRETLRKYPLTVAVRRVTTKPYAVPDDRITLEPGTLTVVPVHAIHHDGRQFPAPESFQPHRFPEQLSPAYMPHGCGPQSYIGKHFVGLGAKLILAMMLSKYEVYADSADPGRSPDPFDPATFPGVRLLIANRSDVRETTMSASLRQFERDNRKSLFF